MPMNNKDKDNELKILMALYEPIIGKKPRLSSSFDEVYEKLLDGATGIIIKLPGEPREIVLLSMDQETGNITYANPLERSKKTAGFILCVEDLKKLMDTGGIAFL